MHNGMSFYEMEKQAKKDRFNRRFADIDFITDKGTKIKLKFNKTEYRAYKVYGGGLDPLNLGALEPDNLIEYIKRRF